MTNEDRGMVAGMNTSTIIDDLHPAGWPLSKHLRLCCRKIDAC